MKYVTKKDEIEEIKHNMGLAAEEAKKSICKKSKRGAIIEKNGKIIGRGYNKPTIEDLCNPCIREDIKDNGRVELCSAIHAEQLAILDAVNNGESLVGARMYHIKTRDGKMVPSGYPSCTVCSRIIHESGISEFVLWHKEGYAIYDKKEFNKVSFDYFLKE